MLLIYKNMPFSEGSFTPKKIPELGLQLKEADIQVSGGDKEASLVPPSVKKQDILKMPIEEIKEKYTRRYEMYLELVRDRKYIEATGDVRLTNEDQGEMKKWLTALNSLDQYTLDHKSGKEKTLYERQATVFDDVRKFLEAGGTEGYVKLPTGSGKTVLFTEFIEAIDLKTLVVVPRDLLIAQTEEKFAEHAPDLDYGEVSGKAKEFGRQVTIITYESLLIQLENGQIKPEDFDCLILDEVHMSLSKKRMEAVKKFDKAIKLGFTATPEYSYEKKVSNLLKTEIHKMTVKEAIEDEGMLSSMSAIVAHTEVDLSSVPIDVRTKDFDEGRLARAVNIAGRNQKAVDLYKTNFDGQTAVAFCVGIDHAEAVDELFNKAGVPAVAISGKTKNKKEIFKKYKSGEIKVLCNADLLIAGFDVPKASTCLNLRPTRSRVIAEQRGGRVLRLDKQNPDKWAVIVDFLDKNIPDNQLPVLFADVVDGAEFIPKKKGKGGGGGGGRGKPMILSIPGLEVEIDTDEVMQLVKKMRASDLGDLPRAGANGSFVADGEVWTTAQNFASLNGFAGKTIKSRIASCRFRDGKTQSGNVVSFYAVTDMVNACKDLLDERIPQAGEDGTFEVDGEIWGIPFSLAPIVGLSKPTIESKVLEYRFRDGKDQRGHVQTFYAASDVRKAFSRSLELPEAGPDGTFEIENDTWGTQKALALRLSVNEKTIARRKSECRSRKGRYSGNNEATFYSLSDMVNALAGRITQNRERSAASALVELETAFAKWEKESKNDKTKFNARWLQLNGYGALDSWSLKKFGSIKVLVDMSTNDELKRNFSYQKKTKN